MKKRKPRRVSREPWISRFADLYSLPDSGGGFRQTGAAVTIQLWEVDSVPRGLF